MGVLKRRWVWGALFLLFIFLGLSMVYVQESRVAKNKVDKSLVLWSNIKINGELNIPNDVVDVNKLTGGPEVALSELGIRNILYNNSSVFQKDNINPDYLLAFQKENNINLDRVIINVPQLNLVDSSQVDEVASKIISVKKAGVNVYGVQFDDFWTAYDKHYSSDNFKRFAQSLKENDSSIKIIIVVYNSELSSCAKNDKQDKPSYCDKISEVLPFVDEIAVWLTKPDDPKSVDQAILDCQDQYKKQQIDLGIYMKDYQTNAPVTPELLTSFLKQAIAYKIHDNINDIYLISSYWYADKDYQNQVSAIKDTLTQNSFLRNYFKYLWR